MKQNEIIDAYCRIRKIDQTIPDEVLDFMKDAAIEKLQLIEDHENCDRGSCFKCKNMHCPYYSS
jgi:hypothetical protein